jgi:hypothetical protein
LPQEPEDGRELFFALAELSDCVQQPAPASPSSEHELPWERRILFSLQTEVGLGGNLVTFQRQLCEAAQENLVRDLLSRVVG